MIGRYGGEEFAVILLDTEPEQARRVMDEIRENFGRIRHESDDGGFLVTLSCGIAYYPDFPDAMSLNKEADRLLYEAKRSGRNGVFFRTAQVKGEIK